MCVFLKMYLTRYLATKQSPYILPFIFSTGTGGHSDESCEACGNPRAKQACRYSRVYDSHTFPCRGHNCSCRPNRSEATDDFVRRPFFRMSHGLTNTALALSPFTADVEVRHPRMRRIEKI